MGISLYNCGRFSSEKRASAYKMRMGRTCCLRVSYLPIAHFVCLTLPSSSGEDTSHSSVLKPHESSDDSEMSSEFMLSVHSEISEQLEELMLLSSSSASATFRASVPPSFEFSVVLKWRVLFSQNVQGEMGSCKETPRCNRGDTLRIVLH